MCYTCVLYKSQDKTFAHTMLALLKYLKIIQNHVLYLRTKQITR